MEQSNVPLVRFGILADVQYANIDDLKQYGRIRYYRNSLNLLRSTIEHWKKLNNTTNKIKFILDLGDLVDAVNSKSYFEDLELILSEMEFLFDTNKTEKNIKTNIFHIWGNHEVYGCTRRKIVNNPKMTTAKSLNQLKHINDMTNYYWHDITDRLRLVCLDLYEISPLGYERTDEIHIKATQFLEYYERLQNSTTDFKEKEYLTRFKVYGGAASDAQLKWLENQLTECQKLGKKILLAGHIPLSVEAGGLYVAWNSDEILKLIWSFNNIVIAYLCGHSHIGGYFLDNKGIHHLTVAAILETPPTSTESPPIAEVYEDKLVIKNQNPVGGFTAKF